MRTTALKKHCSQCLIACWLALTGVTASAETIDEGQYLQVGGIDQWVSIHGEDRSNPVIMFLHGGPGNALSPFAEQLLDEWEQHFTLVQWDQPGAGRTYGRSGEAIAGDLSIARMVRDGLAVAETVRKQLGKDKIFLLGGSWGSILGILMAKSRPDLFHAYVGTSQVVDVASGLVSSYPVVLERASRNQDSEALTELEAIGKPPWHQVSSLATFLRIARRYEARNTPPAPSMVEMISPAYSDEDMANWAAGDRFSQMHFFGTNLDGELMNFDVAERVKELEIPILVLQGSEDLTTPPTQAESFIDNMDAPDKRFVTMPHLGHNALMHAPDVLLDHIIRNALPLAAD